MIPTPQLEPGHGSHLIFSSLNMKVLISARAPRCLPLFMSHSHPYDCAGGEPLHKEVSHYSRQKWTRVGSGTCGCGWCQTRRNSLEREREVRREREHRGCWEKIGAGSPFNLLINHANEILTGYSEAVLEGGRKALVLDYTLSMRRAKKRSENMLLNKVMGNFLAHSSQAEPLMA